MIKCNLSKLMGEHKVNIQEVHETTGLNRNTISNLYHEKSKQVHFDTIDKLCSFFDCRVGDLFEYKPQ